MATVNPLEISHSLAETYARYLKTIVTPRDLNVRQALHDAIDAAVKSQNNLIKGTFLEAQPPYVKGASIRDLVSEGLLSAEFLKFNPEALPVDRNLYSHQVRSIRRVSAGHNVIVATGTGSGKTESFLLPVINHLLREKEAGTLGPGVRALLLYPMNALANDQVKRLRGLLADTPDITFGRYTGETESKFDKALTEYRDFEGRDPLPNELISREQMQKNPPHILLTNYAMLEYLLLRPSDTPLFEGPSSGTWKFIVADEAHTYDGAHGVEVANLLTKLRERVDRDKMLQTIGTTATIGKDRDAIREFASSFFGNTFEISSSGESPDLIEPERADISLGEWGPLNAGNWISIASGESSISELSGVEGVSNGSDFELLQSEKSLQSLRKILAAKPTSIGDIALELFGDESDLSLQGVLAMVEVTSKVKNQSVSSSLAEPALSARFHLFARATEGVFSCLMKSPHLSLYRQSVCHECSKPSYEMAGCKRCGGAYYSGSLVTKGHLQFFSTNSNGKKVCLYPANLATGDSDEDDDIYDEEVAEAGVDSPVQLCTDCGLLSNVLFQNCPSCDGTSVRAMRIMEGSVEGQNKCYQCGTRGRNVLRRLESGSDAAVSVLATELYLNMPPADTEDSWKLPGEGRKLMVFSDSRQQAAFFAPYMESTYGRIMWRKLLLQALDLQLEQSYDPQSTVIGDLRQPALGLARQANIFESDMPQNEENASVLRQLHFEAVSTDRQMSLEGTGLIGFEMKLPQAPEAYSAFIKLGLTVDEAQAVLQVLLATLREGGILTADPLVELGNEIFKPRTGPLYVRSMGALPKYKIFSWNPTKGENSRLNYLQRVFAAKGLDAPAKDVLEKIWDLLTSPASPFKDLFKTESVKPNGLLSQLNHKLLLVKRIEQGETLHQCNLCGRLTRWNIAGVCPRFTCAGKLQKVDSEVTFPENHYRSLYLRSEAHGLVAREHTAQLESKQARKVQTDFIQGKVNVLSSSTTFELGVDVGELQSVLLRNVPPTTANYLQRAGRAGRRSDSAALILTYAQRRPHDLAKFADPVELIAGQMRAPYVDLNNKRIFQRHVFSIIFASYFRENPDAFKSVKEVFLDGTSGENTAAAILEWLESNEREIKEKFDWMIPSKLSESAESIWQEALVQFEDLLTSVEDKLQSEVEAYDELIEHALAEMQDPDVSTSRKASAAYRYKRLIDAKSGIVDRDIIGFLSTQNLLPKYGFPVDTVELKARYTDQNANHIEMSRDLAVAIFEYAPGNQLVADGMIWESVGLNVIPGKGIQEIAYGSCEQCGHFTSQVADDTKRLDSCEKCGNRIAQRIYAWPRWGFISHGGQKKPGESAPRIRWNRSLYLAKDGVASEEPAPAVPSPRISAHLQTIADLVVINNGPGAGVGYNICQSCYRAFPAHEKSTKEHVRAGTEDKKCKGFIRSGIQLGHRFETDLIKFEIDFENTDVPVGEDLALSLGYALLEAATDSLQISQDDIDLVPLGILGRKVRFAIVDAVPAGAGFANLVAKNLEMVFKQALVKVERCECGEETSCYECLRGYSNQRVHDLLSRGLAITALRELLKDD